MHILIGITHIDVFVLARVYGAGNTYLPKYIYVYYIRKNVIIIMPAYNIIQNNISKWASRTKENVCRRRSAPRILYAPGNVFLVVFFF